MLGFPFIIALIFIFTFILGIFLPILLWRVVPKWSLYILTQPYKNTIIKLPHKFTQKSIQINKKELIFYKIIYVLIGWTYYSIMIKLLKKEGEGDGMQDLEGYCAVFPCSPNYGLHNAIGVPVRTLYKQMAFVFSMYHKLHGCLYKARGVL